MGSIEWWGVVLPYLMRDVLMPSSNQAKIYHPEPHCEWMKVGNNLPEDEDILVWSGGMPVVGRLLVQREPSARDARSLIDVLGNEILPWPTHWMRIHPPPAELG
jgi:hypothetical protein